MSFLKSVWSDLVEKRLWPVAVALLAALVAVPLLLGGGSSDALPVAGATGASGAGGELAQVSLDAGGPQRLDRRGAVRDPFKQGRAPKTGATGASGLAGAATGGSAGDPTAGPTTPTTTSPGTTGAAGSTGGGTAKAAPAPKPKPVSRDDFAVVLRYGEKGSARPAQSVLRLTPLPTAESPSVVYLGVDPSEKTVSFLLSENVTPTGEVTCRPSKAVCDSIAMAPGDRAELAVTDDDGDVTRWVVDVVRIDKTP